MKSSAKLGRVQHQIMEVLWDRGEATARDITDALSKGEPIAHSTVQTLLRKMEVKGSISHVKQDRAFYFKPLVGRAEVAEDVAVDLLTRIFHGSISDLVAHLIGGRERIDADELQRLRQLIDTYDGSTEAH